MTAAALGAPTPDPGAGEVQTAHSGDFLRLTRLWQHRTHFSLLFAAFDNPAYRDGLIQRLNTVQPGLRMELAATDTPQDWLARLQAATQTGEKRVHALLPARGPEDTARWWQQANVLRERLADAFPATILVWLSDADIDTAAHQAPDLWNWREAVFTFTHAAPVSLPELSSGRFSSLSGPDAQSVQQRLADIEQYLRQAETDSVAAAHLQLEAAQAHERLGQWQESEAAARAAASAFQLAGNALLAAQAQCQITDILRSRGRIDEALAVLQTDCLPVFEKLGLTRETAIANARVMELQALVREKRS
jgi:tetratricopeptide (TPR) repeat protein